MVARQWWKYVIGSAHYEGTGDRLDAWNESSRRYINEEPVFYTPKADEWRSKPENSKQGRRHLMPLVGRGKFPRLLSQASNDPVAQPANMRLPKPLPKQARQTG